jgi:biotin operon repressor
MPRNAEIVRQWRILKTIEAGLFTSTDALAEEHNVPARTIRRDIDRLQEAGFPIYDEWDGTRKMWRLLRPAFTHVQFSEQFTIEPYGKFHAVYDGERRLVCVTVYLCGAEEVRRRLMGLEPVEGDIDTASDEG